MSPRKGFLKFVKLEGSEGCSIPPLFPSLGVVDLMVLASLGILLLWLLILDFDAGVVILNIYVNLLLIFFRAEVSFDDVETGRSFAMGHTANIYSQFTVIGCVTFPIVIWQ